MFYCFDVVDIDDHSRRCLRCLNQSFPSEFAGLVPLSVTICRFQKVNGRVNQNQVLGNTVGPPKRLSSFLTRIMKNPFEFCAISGFSIGEIGFAFTHDSIPLMQDPSV